ncbi:MAG: MnhB domain-containing protein, partial [Alphaproteobacteria bacterium]|nr:MnhB domain-containing protein [Alphaproteobacteria bacterium]
RVAPPAVVTKLVAAGVLIYAGTGYMGLFKGANFLDYGALSKDPVAGQHLGILAIEFGVGTTVAAAMITIFFLFAGRDR